MRHRFLAYLDGTLGRFATHAEAKMFITCIPGVRGFIIDRLYTPNVDAFGLILDDEES